MHCVKSVDLELKFLKKIPGSIMRPFLVNSQSFFTDKLLITYIT